MKTVAVRDHIALYWKTYLACAAFALVIIFAEGLRLYRILKEADRRSWAATTAVIRESELVEVPGFQRRGASMTSEVWLEVTYHAGGILHDAPLHHTFLGHLTEKIKNTFEVGNSIPIRYNPANPSEVFFDSEDPTAGKPPG